MDKLKLRDEGRNIKEVNNALLKYFSGQGGDKDNYTKMTAALNDSQKAKIELAILWNLLEDSKFIIKDELSVIDIKKFYAALENLEDKFQTRQAKDFLNLTRLHFNAFKNDGELAAALRDAKAKELNTGLATSISGAVAFQQTRLAFATIMRLMPKLPFLSSVNKGTLSAATRYHIQKALESAVDIGDVKIKLDLKVKNPTFSNNTRIEINNYLQALQEAQAQAKQEIKLLSWNPTALTHKPTDPNPTPNNPTNPQTPHNPQATLNPTDPQDVILSASEKSKDKDEILRAAQYDKNDEILRAAQYDKIESQNKAESSIKDSTSDAITKESTQELSEINFSAKTSEIKK